MTASRTRGLLIAALLIGVGLIVAPVVFQMFTRAPLGASMIDDFRPYMTVEQIDEFQGYLVEIDAAEVETVQELHPIFEAEGIDYEATYPNAAALNSEWDAIDADMSDLLNTMDENLDNFAAVDALPSFNLFPWFFVIPGALVVIAAALALWALSAGGTGRGPLVALAILGLGLILAPVIFQMFSRAPEGEDMIDSFRPMMTRERVQDVQGYFITLGAAEGELRISVVPAAAELSGWSAEDTAGALPAVTQWSNDWPAIVTDFAPMIAAMSDNVDNYEAVDALPPFSLFPWFFVIPGVLLIGLAVVAIRSPSDQTSQPDRTSVNQGTES